MLTRDERINLSIVIAGLILAAVIAVLADNQMRLIIATTLGTLGGFANLLNTLREAMGRDRINQIWVAGWVLLTIAGFFATARAFATL